MTQGPDIPGEVEPDTWIPLSKGTSNKVETLGKALGLGVKILAYLVIAALIWQNRMAISHLHSHHHAQQEQNNGHE